MQETFRNLSKIPPEQLNSRAETVKVLSDQDAQTYAIVKDKETGEHYLRYTYRHLNIAEGGKTEVMDCLMPLASDDVLGLIFGEEVYHYPAAWKRPYLRSTANGHYVWFDPTGLDDEDETLGEDIRKLIQTFKAEQNGIFDRASIQKLLDSINKRFEEKNKRL